MDAFIDPTKADYSVINGSPARDPVAGLANAAYLRLTTPLGSYWADRSLGSRLHELQRQKDVSRFAGLAKQYAELALRPLLDDGRASDIQVTVERTKDAAGSGRIYLGITIIATSGEQTAFRLPLQVI